MAADIPLSAAAAASVVVTDGGDADAAAVAVAAADADAAAAAASGADEAPAAVTATAAAAAAALHARRRDSWVRVVAAAAAGGASSIAVSDAEVVTRGAAVGGTMATAPNSCASERALAGLRGFQTASAAPQNLEKNAHACMRMHACACMQ